MSEEKPIQAIHAVNNVKIEMLGRILKEIEKENQMSLDGTGYGFHVKEFKELEFFPCQGQQKIFYIDLPEEYKI